MTGVSGFPGFEIVAELGRGSAASVLRVRRAADGAWYALKVWDERAGEPDRAVAMLCREAALLAGANHPALVGIHEVGLHDGRPYLVMDLVEGQSLARLLADGPLAPDRVVALALDLVDPLCAIHRAGLVHRDLKPDNIMVRPDGLAQLIDFGLAGREMDHDADVVVGTLLYSSPEQSGTLSRPVDQRSDLYSLGVVLFECLTGRPPFDGVEVGELLRMHAVMPPPDLLRLAPGTPTGLAAVVSRLLVKDPDDRYQTGADLRTDLRRLIDQPADGPVAGFGGQPLIGRADDLARLTQRWDAARRGAGGVVAIRGGGGIGKTRLAEELVSRVAATGAADGVAMYGAGSPDDPVPMAPLRRAVEGYLRQVASLPAAEAGQAQDRIRACASGAAPLVGRLSPDLAAVLGTTDVFGDDGQHDYPLAVAGFLGALAHDRGGVLLVLDDIQWLDSATERVLTQLAVDLPGTPLLVVATGLDGGESVAGSVAGLGVPDVELTLLPLTGDDVSGLTRVLLPGTTPTDALIRHMITRSTGNPLVIREYVRAIVDAGLLRPSWDRWVLDEAGLDALKLPQDALGLMLTRLHNLAAEAVEVLATAAVAGTVFAPEVIAAVHRTPVGQVLETLREATARGLVEPHPAGDFGFLHVGLRDALAARLDASTTEARHLSIAEALTALSVPADGLPPDRGYAIAHHYLAAGDTAPPERAVPACVAAGEMALSSYAAAEAVTFLSYAQARADAPSVELLYPLGMALKRAGRLVEAARRLDEALALETDPLRRSEIIAALADVYWAGWRVVEAAEMVRRGLGEVGAQLPRNRFVMVFSTFMMVIAAVFMQRTGLGFGAARGAERRRYALIADLHMRGFLLAGTEGRLGRWTVHSLRAVYWGNRIGEGPQYVQGQYTFAIIAGLFGLRRTAAAATARIDADPATSEPALRALTSYGPVMATYASSRRPGADAVIRELEEHGRWLDIGTYAEGIFTLTLGSVGQGRNRDATRLWAQAQRRRATSAGERTAMSMVPVLLAAAHGRHADAIDHLRQLDVDMVGANGTALDHYRYVSRVFALYEQQEIGAPFDEAVAGYTAVGLSPLVLPGPLRITLFRIAMGRIAQLRAADNDTERSVRLTQCREAIATVRRGARDPIARSWSVVARADLLIATDQARRALRGLDGDEMIHRPSVPMLMFERARVRARAYLALGAAAECRQHAQVALTLAQEEGWSHRALWVTAEFPSVQASMPGAAHQSSGTQTRSGNGPHSVAGSTTVGWSDDRRRLRALEHLGAASSRILDPEALARTALDEIIEILRAERAFLFLTAEHDDRLVPHLGRDGAGSDLVELAGYSASLVERVRVDREPLVMTGTEEGAALGAQSVVLHGLRSIMIAPLLLDDRLLGVVYLDSKVAKGIFTGADAGILIALANHIAVALETARAAQLEISIQTAERQRDLADRLRAAFEAMSDTLDPAEVLDRLLHWLGALVPNGGVWLVAAGETGPVLGHLGPDGKRVDTVIAAGPDTVRLLEISQPTLVPVQLARLAPDATSWEMLPLRSRNAEVGVLAIASTAREHRLPGETEMAAALVAQGMTAYDNATLYNQVRNMATTDELTGIANRRHFFELAEHELATAHSHHRPATAMMLDIDHFKHVNDTHGHPTGDDVIREVARRLAEHMRDTDILARYGGEEFTIIATDSDSDTGRHLAERLRTRIADQPIPTRTGPLQITVSIGLSQTMPTDDVTTVLARADQALYHAKQSGRNRTSSDTGGQPAETRSMRLVPAAPAAVRRGRV